MADRLVALIFVALGALVPQTPALPNQSGPVPINATPLQLAELEEAVKRFDTAGLELPPSNVMWSTDPADCNGHRGIFRGWSEPWLLVICSQLDFVLVHELAHSWVRANISEQQRADYVEARGLKSWNSEDTQWHDRGTEEAAFMIQDNLSANLLEMTPIRQDRAAAYELLTGLRSPQWASARRS